MSIVLTLIVAWIAGNICLCIASDAYEAIWRDRKTTAWKVGESVWYSLGLPWIVLVAYLVGSVIGSALQRRAHTHHTSSVS